MVEAGLPPRDAAFALIALLRCRPRLDRILATVAEPRRSVLTRVVNEYKALVDSQLSDTLNHLIRREDERLQDAASDLLGSGAASVALSIQRWAARRASHE